jgi:hypothetical protein
MRSLRLPLRWRSRTRWRSLTSRRRIVCRPRLLLRRRSRTPWRRLMLRRRWMRSLRLLLWCWSRTRWRSGVLCLARMRNILLLRLRRRPVARCVGVRRWSRWMLLHDLLMCIVIRRLRYLRMRSVIRLLCRACSIVIRRMRYSLRVVRMRDIVVSVVSVGVRLLGVVLRRTRRAISLLVWRRAVYCRQGTALCFRRIQSSRLWRCDYRGPSLIPRNKLGGVTPCCLLMLHLSRRRGYMPLPLSRELRRRWLRLNSTGSSVVGDTSYVDIIGHGLVINIGDIGNVYVIDRAIVVKVAATPISAIVTIAGVAESIVNTAVKANAQPPVAGVPPVKSTRKTPIARRPEVTGLRRQRPGSRYPVVVSRVRAPGPVARNPNIARTRA